MGKQIKNHKGGYMNKRLVAILVLILVGIVIFTTSIVLINKSKKDTQYDVYINDTPSTEPDVVVNAEPDVDDIPVSVEAPVVETPVDDTYELASVPVEFDPSVLETTELAVVTDTEIIAKIEKYIQSFHYNYFLLSGINPETGNIDIDAMTLFALSYIMQNEHNELRFDSSTFRLYIPTNHVAEVVQRFFYRKLDVFNVYPDLNIELNEEVYSAEVPDEEWNDDLSTDLVEKMGDFTYKVTCSVTNRTSGTVVQKIVAIIDESKDGLVLVNYKVEEITQ